MTRIPTALTIAGSDASGGAGIQADLKAMTALGVYGMSAITALTAQNTTGVQDVFVVPVEFVRAQLDSVFTDIEPDAVKIGMVASAELVMTIAEALQDYNAKNVVLDPVMVATSGSQLSDDTSVRALIRELLPLADLVTPNRMEAEVLSDMSLQTREDMEKAATRILDLGAKAVLIKGGHIGDDADDYLLTASGGVWLEAERVDNPNTHGTGCTLSSAIASYLAKGLSMEEACREGKRYVWEAIGRQLDIGKGRGPLQHFL